MLPSGRRFIVHCFSSAGWRCLVAADSADGAPPLSTGTRSPKVNRGQKVAGCNLAACVKGQAGRVRQRSRGLFGWLGTLPRHESKLLTRVARGRGHASDHVGRRVESSNQVERKRWMVDREISGAAQTVLQVSWRPFHYVNCRPKNTRKTRGRPISGQIADA